MAAALSHDTNPYVSLNQDMKPNNLLLDKNGILKLADFGLAKAYGSPNRINTHQVVTRWYRAPELLYGSKKYGPGIDIWAVGCIMAELLLRNALFPGESDLGQLSMIFHVTGTPDEKTWPGHKSLSDYIEVKYQPAIPFRDIFTAAPDDMLDVLKIQLSLNPAKRGSCQSLLRNPYFSNKPLPTAPNLLPRPTSGLMDSNPNKRAAGETSETKFSAAKRLHFD